MTLLHRELGSKSPEKQHINIDKDKTQKGIGKKALSALRWGPKITSDMLYPEPLHTHKDSRIKGIPTEQVIGDPSILIAPDEKDLLIHVNSRGAGDYTKDNKWQN